MTNVLALLLVKDLKNVDAIPLLTRAGFQAREVAALLGTSANAVSVLNSQLKKNAKKKTKGRRGED